MIENRESVRLAPGNTRLSSRGVGADEILSQPALGQSLTSFNVLQEPQSFGAV